MSAITPNTSVRLSMGSATLLLCGFTTTSGSDTWTPSEVLPVIDYWIQPQGGIAAVEPDTSYNSTTGVFTFVSGSTSGPMKLFLMLNT